LALFRTFSPFGAPARSAQLGLFCIIAPWSHPAPPENWVRFAHFAFPRCGRPAELGSFAHLTPPNWFRSLNRLRPTDYRLPSFGFVSHACRIHHNSFPTKHLPIMPPPNWLCLYKTPRPASPGPRPTRRRHELGSFRTSHFTPQTSNFSGIGFVLHAWLRPIGLVCATAYRLPTAGYRSSSL
jgi:hypothetical protein